MQLRLAVCALLASAGAAQANLLVNPGFEDPDVDVELAGAAGWNAFNDVFTVDSTFVTPNSGDQVLKVFGGASGVFQDFPASEGQLWDGGAWVLNDPADPLAGGQVAAVNIEWIDAGGNQISFISNGETISTSPQGEWTLRPISGVAPAGTVAARLTLITGAFDGGGLPGGGGAPKFDDAFFAQRIPEPASIALVALLGCSGLVARRR